jgi:hypothetical protein
VLGEPLPIVRYLKHVVKNRSPVWHPLLVSEVGSCADFDHPRQSLPNRQTVGYRLVMPSAAEQSVADFTSHDASVRL